MKKLVLLVLVLFCGLLLGRETPYFEGRYDDFDRLSQVSLQNRQSGEFTFTRLIFSGRIPGYYKNWYTDYPTGDENLVRILRRTTDLNISEEPRAIPIHHADLFNYPMVYAIEAGQMVLDESDGAVLREYLIRGGFWMIDDFWGTVEWANFEREMKKVFPDLDIVDIPITHQIFHTLYDIDEVMQVPSIAYKYYEKNPITWEQDGFQAHARGIFADDGRLMVFINFNTDLMDASEWADDPKYPNNFSVYSIRMFTNAIIYSMTH